MTFVSGLVLDLPLKDDWYFCSPELYWSLVSTAIYSLTKTLTHRADGPRGLHLMYHLKGRVVCIPHLDLWHLLVFEEGVLLVSWLLWPEELHSSITIFPGCLPIGKRVGNGMTAQMGLGCSLITCGFKVAFVLCTSVACIWGVYNATLKWV